MVITLIGSGFTLRTGCNIMKVGIIGGTGGMGEGFALRWAIHHEVIIGSRDSDKAKNAAVLYMNAASSSYGTGMNGNITGSDNTSLASLVDVLILSIPYDSIQYTCSSILGKIRSNCIVVSPIVPMNRTESGFIYVPFEETKRSAAAVVAENLPDNIIVSAFHTISEVKLKNINESLDSDTFVCCNDQNALAVLNTLISEISGLRPIYLGPLSLSYQAEVLTPMILNASKRNKIKHPGIKLVS
jgi:8-hydroxy-5-deazaflavin:NADPH oxidoreductase